MNIADKLFVSIDYTLTLDSGEEIDSSKEYAPLGFVTGTGHIMPGLEKALMGMKAGDTSKVTVEPEDGYGSYSKELVHEIPRNEFPAKEKIEPGMTFETEGPQGRVIIRVTEVNGDESVTVDLNHPLAGKQLIFDVKIVDVREPSQEEIAQLTAGCACGSASQDACGPDCGCGSNDQSQSGGCGCH